MNALNDLQEIKTAIHPNTEKKLSEKAKKLGYTRTAYVRHLINKDINA